MSRAPQPGDPGHHRDEPGEPVAYPTNQVLAVLDSEDATAAAVHELVGGGFLDSEVHVSCGTDRADALRASAGRRGLAGLAIRVAERLGLQDSEMEFKSRYEQAMRDGKFVVRVLAPSEERKALAVDILGRHGAHGVSYHGRYTIEDIHRPASP